MAIRHRAVLLAVTLATSVLIVNSFWNEWTVHCRSRGWKHADPKTMTKRQMVDYLQWTNSSSCLLSGAFGGSVVLYGVDGQKSVCLDGPVRPVQGQCLVYSFGVNDEWSFERDMEQYGCEVFAFDPSMNTSTGDYSDNIHFARLGLSGRHERRGTWNLETLSAIYHRLSGRHGHRVIDYLKLDIEGDEWESLEQILQSGMLDRVRQLAVEVHLLPRDDYLRPVTVLKTLENYGLIRFDSKPNPYTEHWSEDLQMDTYWGYEVAWYNGRLRDQLVRRSSKLISPNLPTV